MEIIPNSEIKIIKNCPLDSSYQHTYYFDSETEQRTWFLSNVKHTLPANSYQRVDKGTMRVKLPIESLYNCSYMMFKNSSFENKWFYAFINSAEYVNNVTTQITYEIDVMQTWFFEFTPGSCFVEREHSATDRPGDNLVKEELNTGEYITHYKAKDFEKNGKKLTDLSVVYMYNPSVFDPVEIIPGTDEYIYDEGFYGGVYQGVKFLVFPAIEELTEDLNQLANALNMATGGGLLGMFLMPTMFLPDDTPFFDGHMHNGYASMIVNRPDNLDGYYPKNKKLLTYPYVFAHLTSHRGNGNDFAFEYGLNGNSIEFWLEGALSGSPSVMAYPAMYKGESPFLDGSVSIDAYPVCTWASDGIHEWVNNHMFKEMLQGAYNSFKSSDGNSGKGKKSGANLKDGVYAWAIKEIISVGTAFVDPGTVNGGVKGDVLFGNTAGKEIDVVVKCIRKESAKIIDDYFSMFGYATNQVKVPNRNSRVCWNYVKTVGCFSAASVTKIVNGVSLTNSINNTVPGDDLRRICSIYDNGVTFWHQPNALGNYSLDNSPRGGS